MGQKRRIRSRRPPKRTFRDCGKEAAFDPEPTCVPDCTSHGFRTLNGRVVSVEGAPAPKNVALIEWDSVDDAVAFYKSKAWTDLAPQREKAQKTIRRYVVEVEK